MKELNVIEVQQVAGAGALTDPSILLPIGLTFMGIYEAAVQSEESCRQAKIVDQISCVGFKLLEGAANGAKHGITLAWVNSLYSTYHSS